MGFALPSEMVGVVCDRAGLLEAVDGGVEARGDEDFACLGRGSVTER